MINNIINIFCEETSRKIIRSDAYGAVNEAVTFCFHNAAFGGASIKYKLLLLRNKKVVSFTETTTNQKVITFNFKLNSLELAHEFVNHRIDEKLPFNLLVWDVTNEKLLVNDEILIQNNKFNYQEISNEAVLFTPRVQYSIDGKNWFNDTLPNGSSYLRFSFDSGVSWTSKMKLINIKGDKGDKGEQGIKGDKGDKGSPFSYNDLTEAQKAEIAGVKVNPNLLINGNFQIWQRGESLNTNDSFGCDCWRFRNPNNGYFHIEKNSAIGGMKMKINNPNGLLYFFQAFETESVRHLFEGKVNVAIESSHPLGIMISGVKKGGGEDVFYAKGGVIDLTGGTPDNYHHVRLRFTPPKTTDTITIKRLKMEIGDTFTGWTEQNFALDLAECQRYYHVIKGAFVSKINSHPHICGCVNLQYNMRTMPTVSFKTTTKTSPSQPAFALEFTKNNCSLKPAADWNIHQYWYGDIILSAEL